MYKQHVRRTILFTILGAIVGLILTFILPKIYESNLELLMGQNSSGPRTAATNFTSDVDEILRQGVQQSAETERQILSSQGVYFGAYQKTMTDANLLAKIGQWQDWYRMYNVQTARTNGANTDNAAVANAQVKLWDPLLAQKLAVNIQAQYDDVRKENAQKATANAIAYLQSQLPGAQKASDDARKALEDFKNQNNIANYEASLRELTGLVSQLQLNKDNIDGQVRQAEGEVGGLQGKVAGLSAETRESKTTQMNPKIPDMNRQIQDLNVKRTELLAQYYPDAEPIKQLDQTISKLNSELALIQKNEPTVDASHADAPNPQLRSFQSQLGQKQAELDGLRQRQQESDQSLAKAKQELASLPSLEAKITALETENNLSKSRYETVKSQLTALKDRTEISTRAATVLAQPQKQDDPVSPDRSKYLFLGAIAGLSLGLILSYLIESLKLRIHTSSQLTELTGLPVAAAVPSLRGSEAGSLKAQTNPQMAPAESYRFMSFAMLPGEAAHHSFMFTGVKNAVGSFSSALQFAKAAAQGGAKVLLVDGDLVKKGISKSFDSGDKRGFNNLLVEDPSALHNAELVVGTSVQNLFLLPAGNADAKSVAEVNSSRLESVVEALKKYADVVIFAVPPCDILSDASAIARFVDDTCLVVSARTTNYRQIPAAHEILQRSGATKVSLILTDANIDEEAFTRRGSYLTKAGQ